jgi:hypothetical protein
MGYMSSQALRSLHGEGGLNVSDSFTELLNLSRLVTTSETPAFLACLNRIAMQAFIRDLALGST